MFTARKYLLNHHPKLAKLDLLAQASLPSRRFIMSTAAANTRTEEPINLVSVNTAPERAKRLIGILIEDVKDKYNIKHAGNSDSESRVGRGRHLINPGRRL